MPTKKSAKWSLTSEMDHSVKRMLKLIEEEGDSFAKKAEMYFQKRPELISHVEEFYRMYRTLAERYDHVTGELRKSIPSDLQSQGSCVSDVSSEPNSSWHSPEQKHASRRSSSSQRAPGFDVFLGPGGSNSDAHASREGYESSTLDYESESDDSSINTYSGTPTNHGDQWLRLKVIELEVELRDVREKLRVLETASAADNGTRQGKCGCHCKTVLPKEPCYEEELMAAKHKVQLLDHELSELKTRLHKYVHLQCSANNMQKDTLNEEKDESMRSDWIEEGFHLVETFAKLLADGKLLEESLQGCENEIEILKGTILDAEKGYFLERSELQDNISRLVEERGALEKELQERQRHCWNLEEEMRRKEDQHGALKRELSREIEKLGTHVAERDGFLKALEGNLDNLKVKNEMMTSDKEKLSSYYCALAVRVNYEEGQIDQMDKDMKLLHLERAELISGSEAAHNLVKRLQMNVERLEKEIERQRVVIMEGAEQKREAIRQLCFSMEHYRTGYRLLCQSFRGSNKKGGF